MLSFLHDGEVGFSGIWTAITAARGFDAALLDVPQDATHYVRYTTGATAALTLNEVLTGGTSSATCRLVAQAVENGTAGSSDSGILFVKEVSGTFEAETLTGGVSTGTVAIAEALIPLRVRGLKPKVALITIESFAVNFTLDGTTPTVTAGTNYGHTMIAGQNYAVRGLQNIRNFKAINAVASSGAIIKYSLFF
jgi:hypothetical protein